MEVGIESSLVQASREDWKHSVFESMIDKLRSSETMVTSNLQGRDSGQQYPLSQCQVLPFSGPEWFVHVTLGKRIQTPLHQTELLGTFVPVIQCLASAER